MREKCTVMQAIRLAMPVVGALLVVALGVYLMTTDHPQSENQTIIRWVVDPHPIRQLTIKLFEKKHPGIHVINDADAGSQRLLTQLAGDVPPDVMAIYTPESLRKFAENDLLLDLRPYVKKYKIPVDDLWPELKPFVYYKGKIVGIPENCGTLSIYYNKKLFREAGVPYPKPGWTWDDCLETARKLTKYKTVNGRPVPVQKGLYVMEYPHYFVWMYGGELFSKDGKKCLLNEERAKKGIRFWADLRMKHKVIPTASEAQSMAPTGGYGGDLLLFQQGKVAMILTGRFMISLYRNQKGLDWDVANYPRGENPVVPFGGKCYAIPKSCRNKDAAIKFVAHLLSRDNQKLIADFGDGIPTRRNKLILKDLLYNPQYPKEKKNYMYLDDMKQPRAPLISPFISESDFSNIVNMELGKVWLGEQSADEACDKISTQSNAIIRRNLANPNFLR